ncbi:hypothetical protein BH23ACT2_BH23ACT2_07260 [soil metagenome]
MAGNPSPADGIDLPPGLIAAVDEAAAETGGGIHYLIAAAVVLEHGRIRSHLLDMVATRQRGFHWRREGPAMRASILDLIEEHGVVAHVRVRATARRRQVEARSHLLAEISRLLVEDGVDHLVIESQGAREDGRDRASLLDTFNRSGGVPFTYDWRTKAEPLLWIADAVGGACREHLIGQNSEPFERLHAIGAIGTITYA